MEDCADVVSCVRNSDGSELFQHQVYELLRVKLNRYFSNLRQEYLKTQSGESAVLNETNQLTSATKNRRRSRKHNVSIKSFSLLILVFLP